MKNILIIGLLFLGCNLIAQKPGNENVFGPWTVAHKDTCWTLDPIGEGRGIAIQVEEQNMLNGYFKLWGKSSTSSVWVQYGSGSFTQGTDSINIATLVGRGLTSSGWTGDAPLWYDLKVCFYHVLDTVGTLKVHQTIIKR